MEWQTKNLLRKWAGSVIRMLVCLREASRPGTRASGRAGNRGFKAVGASSLYFLLLTLHGLKLHYSLPQSCLHNTWCPTQNKNMRTLVRKAEKSFFLVSMVFLQTYYGFLICYLISLSPGPGDTCRASATFIQCGQCESVCEMCVPLDPPHMDRRVAGGSLSGGKGGGSPSGGDREMARDSRPLVCDPLSYWMPLIILVS